ncbi:hypothetical protein FRC02_006848 [Tulasnella sp. 418]|nr:hypothetical protein FRC02_006848 [Tulasnella sp. 418]
MPVPWEAMIPFGLLTAMFGVTGTAFSIAKRATNDGKPPRYRIDQWEEMMMERDKRITGSIRGQKSDTLAPESFSTNSAWYTSFIYKE